MTGSAASLFKLRDIFDTPAHIRQRLGAEFQRLEFVAIAVIARKAESACGREPEAGIVGRAAQQDNEGVAEAADVFQPVVRYAARVMNAVNEQRSGEPDSSTRRVVVLLPLGRPMQNNAISLHNLFGKQAL